MTAGEVKESKAREDNWKEITDNLSWNIETEIEER